MGYFPPSCFAAAVSHSRLTGDRALCCMFPGIFLLLAVFCLLLPHSAFAINAPTVTHIAGKAVVPAATMYANTAAFEIRGNAEGGAQIRLHRGAVQIATSTATADGVWSIFLPAQPENSYVFSAVAFDGLFMSEPSVAVPVIVDTTPPSISIQYGSSGCRSGQKYQCNNIGYIRAIVSDSRSGIDFSTANITVDYVTVPSTGDPDDYVVTSWSSLPGYIDNNGTNEVNYYSNTGFGTINQNYRKIRILAKISDRAGNQNVLAPVTFYNNARANQLAAIVDKIWDPGHNVFTGIGEPVTNIPDASGWVNYYENMTVVNNPIKIKARAQKWSLANKSFDAWGVYCETFNRSFNLNQTNGEFILDYPVLSYGNVTLVFGPLGGDCRPGQYSYVKIRTLQGAPFPIQSFGPYSGEVAIIGSRVWPTFTGKVAKMPFNQTVQIGFGDYSYTTWLPSLSQVIKPQGQACAGTPSVYDQGDVWYDANDNGNWDAGEPFYDMAAKVSDGESFTLINFTGQVYNHNNLTYLGGLVRNNLGKSTAVRIVRAHNNDTYPPLLNEIALTPAHSTPFRRTSNRPTLIRVVAQTWAGNYSGAWTWWGGYYLDYPGSKVSLVNGQGTPSAVPVPVWSHLGSCAFQGEVNLAAVPLSQGTYRIGGTLLDGLTNSAGFADYWFKIDDTPPSAAEMVPADGQLSNTFTSFNAKIVDPNLPDGTAGSGADIDVANPQIIPFRLLSQPSTVNLSNQTSWIFNLTDGEPYATDHRGTVLANGSVVQIWTTAGGVYGQTAYTGTISANTGNGKITVSYPAKFSKDITYVILATVPFFTSNNGVDRVGAVPVSQITADGTYVTRVITRDRSGNTGTFFTTSSPLEVPVGLITFTFDKPFLFTGLFPADVGTFTTSAVTTRKGNKVVDGQPLSLVQMPSTLTNLVPPDANGIPGDGHQVLFGKNGAPAGSGQACFGLELKSTIEGSVSVFGVIGLASGTSSPVPIYRLDAFTLAPQTASLEITPAVPNPQTSVVSSFLGKLGRSVPDGSLATFTTNFGTVFPDANPILPGIQTSALNGSASVFVTAATKGVANISMQIGGLNASTLVTFIDKYPPPAPANVISTPQYSNTGSTVVSWDASVDIGGAGTSQYLVEQSANSGAWVQVAAVSTVSATVSGLADGSYRYRVRAVDADGNIGAYSVISASMIVDKVAPPAVACSDIGAGNNDPDQFFSWDPNIYFYFNPTDDRSGVGEVQVQVSITPDITGLVQEPWIPAANFYLFTEGLGFREYYARVRVKDRAGNIGAWGTWSNGIQVVMSGAVTPPNAPTITKIAGKNAVPGTPVPINLTSNIEVRGMAEALNLIQVYVDNVYLRSIISDGSGAFSTLINLPAGSHTVKVKAHNGFAESAFSAVISIIVDTALPVMTRTVYDIHGYTRGEVYLGTTASDHKLASFDFYLTDTGGSGYDITTALATLTDIDDAGNPLPAVAPYQNPVASRTLVISADRVRLEPPDSWASCLRTGNRYRLAYSVSDKAGNTRSYTFDFIIDNTKPGLAPGVPSPSTPPECNFKTIYVYNEEMYPWSTWPPASALVPFKWNAAYAAFMIDPAFNNPLLVDSTSNPPALLFNTPALYGTLYEADRPQPAVKKGYDSRGCTVAIAWGYSAAVVMGPDGLNNSKSFRFPFRTMINGVTNEQIVDQDWAICRNYFKIRFDVNSANPAPRPPTGVSFVNAADTAVVYPVWLAFASLYGEGGGSIRHHDCIITDNSNDILVRATVPVELFDQRVEVVAENGSVITSANVSPGNTQAIIPLSIAAPSGTLVFQLRTYANGYYSTTQPRNVAYYYYRWIKGDTTPPITYDVYPTESFFNALSGADARPFPSQVSVKARDTSNGSNLSFINITGTGSTISFKNSAGTSLPGTLYRDYDTGNMSYGFRFAPTTTPTTEGTYNYVLNLIDGARQTPNSAVHIYPFKLDKTPPIPAAVNPGDGEVTNSLPSFNATVADPNLADGSAGSGPNMDPSRVQIFPFKNLGQGTAAATSLTTTVYGVDTTATDHVDKVLPVNTEIWFARLVAGKLTYPVTKGRITVNGGNTLTAVYVSGTALTVGAIYAICYEIPNFPSNDGISKVAAVPVQPAVKGGSYVVFLKLIDNALNQGSYSSASSIYEAAYGTFTLTPSRTQLYVGLYPPHTANYVSSPILTTEGNPIKAGTEVTGLTNRGSFTPADSNGIPGDGHQIKADATGRLYFGLQATGLSTGLANVRTVLGLASGTDTSVNFVQIPAFSATLATTSLIIAPATPNPSTTCTTSTIGNAGDLVPNGTCINVVSTLGTVSPADVYPLIDLHQVTTSAGQAAFSISSANAGVASITIEIGGRSVNKQLTFIDRYPPTAPGKPMPDNVLNNNGAFNLLWTASTDPGNSGISAYSVEFSLNGGAYTFLATSTAANYLTSDLPQGIFTFRVRAVDGAGNIGAYSIVSNAVEVDRTPPLGTITINNGGIRTSNPAVTLTLSASDAKGVADMSFSNDMLTWSGWVPYATSVVWTLSAGDGSKVVYVRYRDTVGNIGIFSDDIIFDTTGPLGGVTIDPAPLSATTTLTLNLFANDGSGVPNMALSFDGGAFSAWVAYTPNYTWNVSTAYATHTVRVKYRDSLLNESLIFSASTCVDSSVPSTPVVTDDGIYSPFIDKLHATWSSSDLQTGIAYYLVRVGTAQGLANVVAEINVGTVTEYTFASLTLDLSGATQYYFTVYAVNGAGGKSLPGYSNGIKGGDPTPPEPFFVTDEGVYTADKTRLAATWTSSNDPDSGLNRYEFSAGTISGGADVVPWTSVGLNNNYAATGLNLTHGQIYYINVRVFNNGGTYTPSYSDGIRVDLLAPPVPAMLAEPAYSSGTANLVTCSTVVDTISGGVQYDFQRSTDAAFTLGLQSSGWLTAANHNFAALVHGTLYYFRVRARDAVGNISSYSAAVNSRQDSNPPTAAGYTDNVATNNDPDGVWSRDTLVHFYAVGLTDDLSGVANVHVQISNDSAFATILSEGWLGNTTGVRSFTAPAVDGSTIYARAKYEDIAGNISGWNPTNTTDGIRIDLTVPVANATTDNVSGNDPNYVVSTDPNIYFGFTHSDAISGVTDVYIQISRDSAFTDIAKELYLGSPATSYLFTEGVDGFTYYARIKVKDRAGWESIYGGKSDGIRVDMSPPDPQIQAFYINKPASTTLNFSDTTTATSTVYITITLHDPSGIKSAYISNDNLIWTTWMNPDYPASQYWSPASISWRLTATPGMKTVYMEFEDGVGNRGTPSVQSIEYYPLFNVASGTRDDKIYPVDTYDEYPGQNKYGVDRSKSQDANRGSSLKLVTP